MLVSGSYLMQLGKPLFTKKLSLFGYYSNVPYGDGMICETIFITPCFRYVSFLRQEDKICNFLKYRLKVCDEWFKTVCSWRRLKRYNFKLFKMTKSSFQILRRHVCFSSYVLGHLQSNVRACFSIKYENTITYTSKEELQ